MRLQQESKPEAIENIERKIVTIKIELHALSKETDPAAIKRREALTRQLEKRQARMDNLMAKWREEKAELDKVKEAKAKLEQAKQELIRTQRSNMFERASELKFGIIPQLEKQVAAGVSTNKLSMLHDTVTAEDVAKVVSRETGIPLSKMVLGEKEKLLHMEEALRNEVVGQDVRNIESLSLFEAAEQSVLTPVPHSLIEQEAIATICNAVRISRAGLHAHERPLGSFLFLGPTGVGKVRSDTPTRNRYTWHRLTRLYARAYLDSTHSIAGKLLVHEPTIAYSYRHERIHGVALSVTFDRQPCTFSPSAAIYDSVYILLHSTPLVLITDSISLLPR